MGGASGSNRCFVLAHCGGEGGFLKNLKIMLIYGDFRSQGENKKKKKMILSLTPHISVKYLCIEL